MLVGYPASIMHNQATNRYHPVFYKANPRPSEEDQHIGCIVRHKSALHHTEGFPTYREAATFISKTPYGILLSGGEIQWDGSESDAHHVIYTQWFTPPSLTINLDADHRLMSLTHQKTHVTAVRGFFIPSPTNLSL